MQWPGAAIRRAGAFPQAFFRPDAESLPYGRAVVRRSAQQMRGPVDDE
jgi:hypothetical protein